MNKGLFTGFGAATAAKATRGTEPGVAALPLPYVSGHMLGFPVGTGYPWAPTDIPGLLFWWRADAGLALSGNLVLGVYDQSGNGRHGVEGHSASFGVATIIRPNATARLNEIYFGSGASPSFAYLQFAAGQFASVTAAHIFAGMRIQNDPSIADDITGLWDFSTQSSTDTHYPFNDGNIYDGFGSATRFTVGNPSPNLASYHQLDVQNQAAGYKLFVNGGQVGSTQTGGGSSWRSQPMFGNSAGSGGNHHLRGAFIDLFMYNRVLTGADLTAARLFVTDRYSGVWAAAA